MRKPRLAAIEYIRGIAMLGVIGIHVGSVYSEIPAANIHMVALLEIMTRFSVPIFFFISAFGLFYNLDLQEKFHYGHFLRRRFRAVLIPYLTWSFFYLLLDSTVHHTAFPDGITLLYILFFGTAKYHIYFLVILLWFYVFMPLWIGLIRHLGKSSLALLFCLQLAFNYASSTILWNVQPENPLFNELLTYRLNYWVLHYLFIFVLGGWLATHFTDFQDFLQRQYHKIALFFFLSMATMLFSYYQPLLQQGITAMEAAEGAHQLTPIGGIYTVAASVFFFALFSRPCGTTMQRLLSFLGGHSHFIYLGHPVAIHLLTAVLQRLGIPLDVPDTAALYLGVLAITAITAVFCRWLGCRLPLVNFLMLGLLPAKK